MQCYYQLKILKVLSTLNWSQLFKIKNCTHQILNICDTITQILNIHSPLKNFIIETKAKPSIRRSFVKLVRKKFLLGILRTWHSRPIDTYVNKFKELKDFSNAFVMKTKEQKL